MRLSELLSLIDNVAKSKRISAPFVCGGVPRDRVLQRTNDLTDVDLTTGDKSIHMLAKEIATKLQSPQVNYVVMPDQHSRITIGDFKLDFSSNFIVPQIDNILSSAGISKPTAMQREVFSRDFTCNSLLMSMDMKNIMDPTGSGVNDIQKKHIKTCLSPAITLGLDNKRIVRILYLAAKLGFEVDEQIIKWVKSNPSSLSNVKQQYLSKKLQKALNYNEETTLKLLDKMGLWSYVPPLPSLLPYMSRNVKRI